MASFARSCRAAWATNSAVASSSTAQSSSTGPSSLRLLTTSAPALAAKAAKPRQPAKKQKAANKKASSSGPRSVGPRKRSGGDSSNAASATLSTPFYKQSANMSHVPTLVPEEVAANLNRAMAFSDTALDAFQKFGVEKKLKRSLGSYIRPVSVVRQATLDLYDELDSSVSSPKKLALRGAQSTGKSYLLLQAVSYALSSEWLVIHLPRLIHWINSSSPFIYSSEVQAYLQPAVTQSVLSSILSVNSKSGVLAKIKINEADLGSEPLQGISLPDGATLLDLLKAATGTNVSALTSQRAFDILLTVLSSQSSVPTLLAIDDLQALYNLSSYRNPDYEYIQSYEFAPIRSLIRFLAKSGDSPGGLRKGTILGALSRSHSPWQPGNEIEAVLNEAQEITQPLQRQGLQEDRRLDAHAAINASHLAHAKSSGWSLFRSESQAERWANEELAALYEIRRSERRSWTVPAAAPSAASGAAGSANSMSIAQQAMFARAQAAAQNAPGVGGSTEDELFLMRVLDSGRNPARFDRSLVRTSLM